MLLGERQEMQEAKSSMFETSPTRLRFCMLNGQREALNLEAACGQELHRSCMENPEYEIPCLMLSQP